MSTLGDLLAEHTVLPGNAVDHLHAVVGEWQLLADLSFADFLMWVRRDDGALVCVAQVRPNTAPTVLLADAVGTLNQGHEMPVVTDAFNSGAIGRQNPRARIYSRISPGLNVEAVPVRYNNNVVAVLTHQTALAATQRESAGKRLPRLRRRPSADVVRRHLPQRRGRRDVAVEPARRRRFHPPQRNRHRHVRQSERHLGLSPDGPGGRAGGPQPGHGHPAADLGPVRGPGTGRPRPRLAGGRFEHAHGGRRRRGRGAAAHAATRGARRRCRCRRC